MADPTILSGSSLNTWNECPREWEYVYLWRLERPPSFKMALGTAAHAVVERAMLHWMEHGTYPEKDFWSDVFVDEWRMAAEHSSPRNDSPEEQEEPHIESGLRCVEFYRTDIAPTIVPYAVEMPIRFTINGWVWTGTADLLEKTPTGIRLRDHKFSSKRPDNPARYRWPMIGYAIGIRRQLGVVEEDVILDYVIRNKKPVHHPVALGGPASDQDIVDLAQAIEDAMTTINRGLFPPLGQDTGACNWCNYANICPDVDPKVKARHAARQQKQAG